MNSRNRRIAVFFVTAALATVSAGLSAAQFGSWSNPIRAEALPGSANDVNTDRTDGCPILDPYTNDLFIARESDQGDLDIWRAPWNGNGWGSPVNLGAPINTADDEFCPSPARGNRFFFIRRPRGSADGDIFVARTNQSGYGTPERLPNPINSPAQEWSPSYYEENDGTPVLYFSSTRDGTQDIWFSRNWGAPQKAEGLNFPDKSDARPNVRRDGLEIVFDSDRAGGNRIWTSYRESAADPWKTPVQLSQLNGPSGGDSRASISWDGTMLVFGSTRAAGNADVYVASRSRATGSTR